MQQLVEASALAAGQPHEYRATASIKFCVAAERPRGCNHKCVATLTPSVLTLEAVDSSRYYCVDIKSLADNELHICIGGCIALFRSWETSAES